MVVTAFLTRLQDGGWHFGRLGLDVWASFLCLKFDLRLMQIRLMRSFMILKLLESDKPVLKILLAHAFKEGWPLEELFNKHSLEMFATGLYLRFLAVWNHKSICLGHLNYAQTVRCRTFWAGIYCYTSGDFRPWL